MNRDDGIIEILGTLEEGFYCEPVRLPAKVIDRCFNLFFNGGIILLFAQFNQEGCFFPTIVNLVPLL